MFICSSGGRAEEARISLRGKWPLKLLFFESSKFADGRWHCCIHFLGIHRKSETSYICSIYLWLLASAKLPAVFFSELPDGEHYFVICIYIFSQTYPLEKVFNYEFVTNLSYDLSSHVYFVPILTQTTERGKLDWLRPLNTSGERPYGARSSGVLDKGCHHCLNFSFSSLTCTDFEYHSFILYTSMLVVYWYLCFLKG